MKALVNDVCNTLLDMDYLDYAEVNEKELNNLLEDLKLLEKYGNGTLLSVVKMLVE